MARTAAANLSKELKILPDGAPSKAVQSQKIITTENLQHLQQHIQDTLFSGVVYISDEHKTYRISSAQFEPLEEDQLVFAIHSIGKVYTGVLALVLVQEGVIQESALLSPLEVDPLVMQLLPLSVQQRVKTVTLYDTMIHKGGFGDYLGKYVDAIQSSLNRQYPPPVLYQPEDFLPFAEPEVFPVESGRYSNLGIVLVGLSIQHHYQRKEFLDYNSILKNHVLDKAGIALWCSKPLHGHFNKQDPIAPYLCGSPAGGYWTTVKDLHTFGEWIRQKCIQDTHFMSLIEKYGQEFYSVDRKEIVHGGGIPSSSAFLSVFLDQGITLAIASNKANQEASRSSHLYEMIVRDIVFENSKQ